MRVLKMLHKCFNQALSLFPARLVFATDAEREKDVDDYETGEMGTPYRERTDIKKVLDHSAASATAQIKGLSTTRMDRIKQWARHPFDTKEAGGASESLVDEKLTKIAESKAAQAETELQQSGVAAYAKIVERSRESGRAYSIIHAKITVAEDVIGRLDSEIEELKGWRVRYKKMAEVLGSSAEDLDVPALNETKVRRAVLANVKGKAEKERKDLAEGSQAKDIEKVDTELRSFLLRVDPKIAPKLDEMLLENATGESTDLQDYLNDLLSDGKIEKAEKELFMTAAKELGGKGNILKDRAAWWHLPSFRGLRRKGPLKWGFQRPDQNEIADYYLAKIQSRTDLNEGFDAQGKRLEGQHEGDVKRMKLRIKKLGTVPIGQRVSINIGGTVHSTVMVEQGAKSFLLKDTDVPDMIFAIDRESEKGVPAYRVTYKDTAGTHSGDLKAPEVRHVVRDPVTRKEVPGNLKDEYKDPTCIYFET